MARIDAYVAVDITSAGGWTSTSNVYADEEVIVNQTPDGLYEEQYWGSFSYLDGNLRNGTINEFYASTRPDTDAEFSLIFSITSTSADAATLAQYIAAGDNNRLWGYLCRGADQIYGSDFGDKLNGYAGNDSILGYGGNDALKGNGGADSINGGSGNDEINGGPGSDSLNGSTGNDTFIFNKPLSATTNVDTIVGFSHTGDTIKLDDDIFVKLATGGNHTLSAAQYKENSTGKATESDDRIIYNNSNGALYYDPDGTGPAVAVKFAVIDGSLDEVDQSDFAVVI